MEGREERRAAALLLLLAARLSPLAYRMCDVCVKCCVHSPPLAPGWSFLGECNVLRFTRRAAAQFCCVSCVLARRLVPLPEGAKQFRGRRFFLSMFIIFGDTE